MTAPEWVVWSVTIGGAVVTVFAMWRRFEKRVDRIEAAVFGLEGNNGLKSRVETNEAKLDELPVRLMAIERDINHTKNSAKAMSEAFEAYKAKRGR